MNQKDIHKLKTIYTTILESKEDSGPPYIKIESDGTYYYKNRRKTILHREDGPAIERFNGDKEWWLNGTLHREDGPAITTPNRFEAWYIKGKLHREDGPALIWPDENIIEWWVNDKKLTEKELKAYLANKQYKASHDITTDFEAFD